MSAHANKADALYILGDFFNVWFGDDCAPPIVQLLTAEFAKLQALQIPVYFMRGNRDFLISDEVIRSMHCIPLADPSVITLGAEQVLLVHGDLLTTADQEYQRFRKVVRNPITKFIFLNLPKILRQKITNKIRSNSSTIYKRKLQKNKQIFSITQEAVVEELLHHNVNTMVHGHIHLPGWHEFTVGNKLCKRIVLGDWGDTAQILSYADSHLQLITLS